LAEPQAPAIPAHSGHFSEERARRIKKQEAVNRQRSGGLHFCYGRHPFLPAGRINRGCTKRNEATSCSNRGLRSMDGAALRLGPRLPAPDPLSRSAVSLRASCRSWNTGCFKSSAGDWAEGFLSPKPLEWSAQILGYRFRRRRRSGAHAVGGTKRSSYSA
jgi:hypothetical protein